MGYAEAKDAYKTKHGKTIRNSWIANVLDLHGKTTRKSPARKGDYKYPCPDSIKSDLESVLKSLKMI
ncbi:MAG: hypothetical protein HOE01_04225 [Thaumarchaeota archaeon]|jgi:hypothetical protein|nr:hypothetical protein [Nitrososphaerota archaeon]